MVVGVVEESLNSKNASEKRTEAETIGPSDDCRICGFCIFDNSGWACWSLIATENIFIESIRLSVAKMERTYRCNVHIYTVTSLSNFLTSIGFCQFLYQWRLCYKFGWNQEVMGRDFHEFKYIKEYGKSASLVCVKTK